MIQYGAMECVASGLDSLIKQEIYSRFQFIDVEWLGEIIIRSGTDRNQLTVFIIERGDDDNGCMDEVDVGAQHPAQLEAIGFRHHQVKDK